MDFINFNGFYNVVGHLKNEKRPKNILKKIEIRNRPHDSVAFFETHLMVLMVFPQTPKTGG